MPNNWKDKLIIGALGIMLAISGWVLKELITIKVVVATLSTQSEERLRASLVNQTRFDGVERDLKELRTDVATVLRRRP